MNGKVRLNDGAEYRNWRLLVLVTNDDTVIIDRDNVPDPELRNVLWTIAADMDAVIQGREG
jgi:hypothetical protein